MKKFTLLLLIICLAGCSNEYYDVPLKSQITAVQPMTGIVCWASLENNNSDAISMEFEYCLYNDVVKEKGIYDWSHFEKLLDDIASRGHQGLIRFRYTYVGEKSAVPDYIRQLPDYEETAALSEGHMTYFPDWRNKELQRFHMEFYQKFAERYDNDPRIAFLQTGFGLWAEYHIYDGPYILGQTFPSKEFQKEFIQSMGKWFHNTPWSISIDAANGEYTPFPEHLELVKEKFGVFDDSFMHKDHQDYNTDCWNFFGRDRYKTSPAGGEFSYYSKYDQQHCLDKGGMYGRVFEDQVKAFHMTYINGNDQPSYQTPERVKEASMSMGYKYQITGFKSSEKKSIVTIKNIGVAPIYRDAWVAVNGVRSDKSLITLQPEEEWILEIPSGGKNPIVTIECDHLVKGQKIEFQADL